MADSLSLMLLLSFVGKELCESVNDKESFKTLKPVQAHRRPVLRRQRRHQAAATTKAPRKSMNHRLDPALIMLL